MSFFRADGIDDDIHSKHRLTIMFYLSTVAKVDFVKLKDEIGIPAGNLSQNLKKLAEAGYVQIDKTLVAGKPKTTLSMTMDGHKAFDAYRAKMRQIYESLPHKRS
jgi:DNA-binding MarR family transcriptional regulator